jgi:hypothetical protein
VPSGRPPNIIPTERRKIAMSEEIWARVDMYLYSSLEECVPKGHYKEFFERAVTHYFLHLQTKEPV